MIQPYFEKDDITVYQGDLLDVLPQLPEASVDCVVTDPPYGLRFMEKGWDHDVPGPAYWQAISRVCKPGALLLAFGGTRTHHRLTCAIEDTGWEIRDCLMWLHGQGFPKSLDISKAIDKAAGAVREVIGASRSIDCVERGYTKVYSTKAENSGFGTSRTFGLGIPITAPATPEAAKWNGWGTALKPAWEPIVLAMKPLDGTFATNAEKHGVAGLNIDASRIGTDDLVCNHARSSEAAKSKGKYGDSCAQTTHQTVSQRLGRFPANLLLDEEAAQQLDAQTGTITSGKMKAGQQRNQSKGKGGYHGNFPETATANGTYGDSGGASRFFYCAKANKSERGPGNDHPTVKPLDLMKYLLTLVSTPNGGVILDPFAGSGTTALAAQQLGRRCICVELDKHNCDITVARLEA
jgi:site-specific DNA-methyltransferase (adenine-specific)